MLPLARRALTLVYPPSPLNSIVPSKMPKRVEAGRPLHDLGTALRRTLPDGLKRTAIRPKWPNLARNSFAVTLPLKTAYPVEASTDLGDLAALTSIELNPCSAYTSRW